MELNDVLRAELQGMERDWGARVIGHSAPYLDVLVPDVPVAAGFEAAATPESDVVPGTPVNKVDVLLRVHVAYPHSAPDMFWVRPHLRLPGGAAPGAAEHIEAHQGLHWQRFSWHLSQPWRPLTHTLADTYMKFVTRRLKEPS